MPEISKEEIMKAVERYKRGKTSQKAEAKKHRRSGMDGLCSKASFPTAIVLCCPAANSLPPDSAPSCHNDIG
ncbi:MAG: hypothetical protein PUF71_07800 [Firmicutes bacterium]|nr:hypothetical protein [Bacillota bacterium]